MRSCLGPVLRGAWGSDFSIVFTATSSHSQREYLEPRPLSQVTLKVTSQQGGDSEERAEWLGLGGASGQGARN